MITQFNNVSVRLDKKEILRHLDWSIEPGQVVGLLGKNGAGKSTLIRTLLGLIPVADGELKTLGIEPRSFSDEQKQDIAYVPQVAVGYEGFKVKTALKIHASCYARWNQALAERMLHKFDIESSAQVDKLSTGQRQAFMLMLALASSPKFLVMDEPVASLDPAARRDVLQFVAEAAGGDTSILYSTHITADLNRLTDKVAMLAGGKICFYHSTEALAQSVLIKGVPSERIQANKLWASNLLLASESQAIFCAWDTELEQQLHQYLGCTSMLVQPLNLEELFIRWHRLNTALYPSCD
ncbi:ABC transporter ATP-binding protein [Agaribacterium sp. ZY112]|uniref:ABC transporter ATP-binding protein n=1 Tax=Agaribacterium sp. ZY112 TaxID=3233574 RepID=UPI00352655CF